MISKLEMFVALAREQHFGRAAESLGVTQPTLSAGIKHLEGQLGVLLVMRGSRFGGLTPEGQRALLHARRILTDTKRLRDDMRLAHDGLTGQVRLAVIPTALTWASKIAADFAKAHPNVSFTILSRTSSDIIDMIDNFEIDVGLTYLANEQLGRMTNQPIYQETYALVIAETAPLADATAVDWVDIAPLNLCLLTPDMQNRQIINRAFQRVGVDPITRMESNSTVVLTSHVEAGGWATILPTDLARTLAAGRAMRVVPIRAEGEPGPSVGLIAPAHDPQTPVLKALFNHAAAVART